MEQRNNSYKEGKAQIVAGNAFLNPESRFSRDISVAFVSLIAKKNTKILDATTATGIRGIRYYKETKSKDITMLDMNRSAFLSAKKNVASNKVKAKVVNKSIQEFCSTSNQKFDIIDYDPFGGVAPTAMDLFKVAHGNSYVMVTATDTAVLCGAHANACLRYYDAMPMHNELCYEVGLRILIGYMARLAMQFNCGIDVKVAFSYKHYMRVMMQLKHGAEASKETLNNIGYAQMCSKCGYREISHRANVTACRNCGSQLQVAGKLWTGALNDSSIMHQILAKKGDTFDKHDRKMLQIMVSEPDIPLYYSIPMALKRMKLRSVSPYALIDALKKKGHRAVISHFDISAIKTDAPITVINKELKELSK